MRKTNLMLICTLSLALAKPAAADTQRDWTDVDGQFASQCGGQYECVEDRPLTASEAKASRGHPLHADSASFRMAEDCPACDRTASAKPFH